MESGLGNNTELPPDIGAKIRQAKGYIKTYPHAGRFVSADENTWAAHALLVSDPHNKIGFDAARYPAFDGAFAKAFGVPALLDATHTKYAGLRLNLAVIRNYILNHYLASGIINTHDDVAIPMLQGMATALAESLTSTKRGLRVGSRTISADVAGIEGLGAAKMYAHLAEIQDRPGLMANVKSIFSKPEREWHLPALEDSPFSMAGLAAPPPNYRGRTLPDTTPKTKPSDPDLQERVKEAFAQSQTQTVAEQPQQDIVIDASASQLDEMVQITEGIVETVGKLRSLDTLAEPTREESVEEARNILRWLRNMEFTDRDLEEYLDQGTPIAINAKKKSLHKLVRIFAVQHQLARLRDADAVRDSAVESARDAVDTIALAVAEHTSSFLPDGHPHLARLDRLIDDMPERALMRQTQSVERLLDTVQLGLEHVTGQEVSDLSVASRLQLISERMYSTATELNQPGPMRAPNREESIELARDLISKLRNHPFSGRTIDDIVQNATAEQKAAFAQQVQELAEMFRNLIAEASLHNTNVLDDPTIKDSNTTFGQFAYALSLMAAKEIPSSAAATQQISADVTQMPEHWGEMHDRTIDRLIETADGGLEKVLDDIAMTQDDLEEDLMKEAIEAVLIETDHHHRRKKKKRRATFTKSGKGLKKQLKQVLDITADDYVLNQGKFARNKDSSDHAHENDQRLIPPLVVGLKAEDLETIRQLGDALRTIGQEIKGLAPAITDPSRIAPDDRGAGQRTIERDQQPSRNPSGPRV